MLLMDRESLYYISEDGEFSEVPIRIKTNAEYGGAILAFSNKFVGETYLKVMNFPDTYKIRAGNEINDSDFYGTENLFVFEDIEQIENAYKDQANYDWAKHLVDWPDETNAT